MEADHRGWLCLLARHRNGPHVFWAPGRKETGGDLSYIIKWDPEIPGTICGKGGDGSGKWQEARRIWWGEMASGKVSEASPNEDPLRTKTCDVALYVILWAVWQSNSSTPSVPACQMWHPRVLWKSRRHRTIFNTRWQETVTGGQKTETSA